MRGDNNEVEVASGRTESSVLASVVQSGVVRCPRVNGGSPFLRAWWGDSEIKSAGVFRCSPELMQR